MTCTSLTFVFKKCFAFNFARRANSKTSRIFIRTLLFPAAEILMRYSYDAYGEFIQVRICVSCIKYI